MEVEVWTKGRKLLKRHIERSGIPQKTFAEASGLSQSMLCHILSGKRMPTLRVAFGLERASDGEVPAGSWLEEEEAHG